MPGKPPGPIVLGILAALERDGPMTRAALCRTIGRTPYEVASVVSRLNRPLKLQPKRIHVVGYVYDEEGSDIAYPRAVYAIGDGPDARKPAPDRKAVAKRWRDRKKLKVNSVWQWAMSRSQRAAASAT